MNVEHLAKNASKVLKLFTQKELRGWLFHQAFHLNDRGPRRESEGPTYLDDFDKKEIFKFKIPIRLPKLRSLPFKEDYKIDLKLATKAQTLDVSDDESIFKSDGKLFNSLQDSEDRESLFRLSGLLRSIEKKNYYSNAELRIFFDWIDNQSDSPDSWGAYTIGERVSNICIFLSRSQCFVEWAKETQTKVLDVLAKEAELLFDKLEYLGEELTCNHFSNNGRGLMWASLLFGNYDLFVLGFEIMLSESERIIQKEFMMREGSTHYHFLITRNYFEALWICEQFGADEKIEKLKPLVKRLCQNCKFFFVEGKIPLFGDVSPDFDPGWFFQVAYAYDSFYGEGEKLKESSFGWASHYFENVFIGQESSRISIDEYQKLEKENFVVFCRHNKRGFPLINGHVHCDSGAPVIFYKGKEILADLGRPSYEPVDDIYLRAEAHNSFWLNSRSLEIPQRGFFGKDFQEKRFGKIQIERSKDKITYHFLNYFNGKISISKTIALQKGEVIISYNLTKGPKACLIDLFNFYLEENIEIDWPIGGVLIKDSSKIPSFQAKEYGQLSPIRRLHWNGKIIRGKALTQRIRPLF
ncbi:hypothetical protein OAK75_00290 [Bacteriovoracales bacterium]|nr:hypothetical protein [Bacteriovoracales bacterium]